MRVDLWPFVAKSKHNDMREASIRSKVETGKAVARLEDFQRSYEVLESRYEKLHDKFNQLVKQAGERQQQLDEIVDWVMKNDPECFHEMTKSDTSLREADFIVAYMKSLKAKLSHDKK